MRHLKWYDDSNISESINHVLRLSKEEGEPLDRSEITLIQFEGPCALSCYCGNSLEYRHWTVTSPVPTEESGLWYLHDTQQLVLVTPLRKRNYLKA